MDPLNIALVSYEFPPYGGGEGTYTYQLSKSLTNLGNQVTLVIPARKYAQDADLAHTICEVEVLQVPSLRVASFGLRAKKVLRRLCEQQKLDLIHYTNDYCGFTASRKELKRPIVATIHHTHSTEVKAVNLHLKMGLARAAKYRFTQYLLNRIEHNILVKADRVIAVSNFTAKDAARHHRIPVDKFRIIPNCVDIAKFNPNKNGDMFRSKWNLDQDPVLLYVGALRANKGLPFLFKAFSEVLQEIPNAKLVMVGEASKGERASLPKLLNMSEHNVIFTGRIDEQMLLEAYSAANAVVLPSLMEGFGITLLEAMASGKPCVASMTGGIQEVVRHNVTGILVPPADPAALSRAIANILSDKILAERLGSSARLMAEEHFTSDLIGKQVAMTYQELIDSTR